jgi:peptidoglycan hydrolase-like protein with peptidoglycan-binding domain/cell wall-associated NlpC family hydrolase
VLSTVLGVALTLGSALVDSPPAAALTTNTKKAFIASVVTAAQQSQRTFGVPASVSIAQAIEASEWGTSKPATQAKNFFDTRCSARMTARQFATLAEAQVGKPYVLGAETLISNPNPPKFDCSELVEWLYGRSGTTITDLAAAQYTVTRPVPKGSPAQPGDLVFLRNNPARFNGIGHVAIVTKKLSNGDWEVIEARGRAYGVVRSTLSNWRARSYYAGLRRYAKLVFADQDGVRASAASAYQSGCVTIGSTTYSRYSSATSSFRAHAAGIANDSAYKAVRAVKNSIPKYVEAIAKVKSPKSPADYAQTIKSLIDTYDLTSYDVAPLNLVLKTGDKGPKVSALQHLLRAAGRTVTVSGKFDKATASAVKKYQSAKNFTVDGEAGPATLTGLIGNLESGANGHRVNALHVLLAGIGLPTTPGSTFGKETQASVKDFQAANDLTAGGLVSQSTWAKLLMALEGSQTPTITGSTIVGQTLTATAGNWGPGAVDLTHQWYRGTTPIDGATQTTYQLQPADAGTTITVSVTGTKAGYTSVTRTSTPTATVKKATLTLTPTPKVGGRAKVGNTMKVTPGTWGPGVVTLSYQWYRGSTAIRGATRTTYKLTSADRGKVVTVKVRGSKPGYLAVSKKAGIKVG